jgi:2-aminoethylphosphonate-pyruvate transaminase
VLLRKAIFDGRAGDRQSLALDLYDPYQYMEKTTQGRVPPPTHAMAALAEAAAQFNEQGEQPARLTRYSDNCRTLIDALTALGLKPFPKPELQAPIIDTWHAPDHPAYDFKRFDAAAKQRGSILYPGKLAEVQTFRVGCIGAIGRNEMQQAVNAVAETLREMGIPA